MGKLTFLNPEFFGCSFDSNSYHFNVSIKETKAEG
jgi:hypothetical protein